MPELEPGQSVKCSIPGKRSFQSTVLRVRENGIDVKDPRNGGLRTLHPEAVKPLRTKRRRGAATDEQS